MLKLVKPNLELLPSYLNALDEGDFINMDLGLADWPKEKILENKEQYIAAINKTGPSNVNISEGCTRVLKHHELYWFTNGDEFIGSVPMRYDCDDDLMTQYCGNIGVSIRPSKLYKGYGVKASKLGFAAALKNGLKQIYVSCHPDNMASKKIILKFGGRLSKKFDDVFGTGPNEMYIITL